MPDNAHPLQHIFAALMDMQQDANNYIQKISNITQPFTEISIIYFRELWAYRTIPK